MVPMLLLHTQCCGSPLVCTPTVWHILHTDQEPVLTVQTAQTLHSSATDSMQIQCLHTHCLANTAHRPGNSSDCSDCTDSTQFSNRLHTDPMSAHPLSGIYCTQTRKQFWLFNNRLHTDPVSANPLSGIYCTPTRKQFWLFRLHRLYTLQQQTPYRSNVCTPTVWHILQTYEATVLTIQTAQTLHRSKSTHTHTLQRQRNMDLYPYCTLC